MDVSYICSFHWDSASATRVCDATWPFSVIDRRQVFYIYTYSTAAWLSVQAVALMALPKLVVALVAKDGSPVTGKLI